MADWSDHDLTINGMTIHYYRTGQRGKPPVVLLHGYSDSGLAWTRLANDLAPDYDLIMPDAIWTASHESARILSISQASPYTPPLDITFG